MESRAAKTAVGFALILAGVAVMVTFAWNIFGLNLPVWSNIPSIIVGIPLAIWGIMLIVNIFRK